jgi:hypothetical protein
MLTRALAILYGIIGAVGTVTALLLAQVVPLSILSLRALNDLGIQANEQSGPTTETI